MVSSRSLTVLLLSIIAITGTSTKVSSADELKEPGDAVLPSDHNSNQHQVNISNSLDAANLSVTLKRHTVLQLSGELLFGLLFFGCVFLTICMLHPCCVRALNGNVKRDRDGSTFRCQCSVDVDNVDVLIEGDDDKRYIDEGIHYLMEIPWAVLGLIFFETYFLVALFFAALVMLPGDHVSGAGPHRFLDSFHFSLQTLSTIGYGALSPATPWAHTVVMIESYVGMVMVALGGGILFSRVNRPRPRVAFSEIMTVHESDAGDIHLSTRILNCQRSAWLDAHVSIFVIFQEGESRTLRQLKLSRDFNPVFRGGWLLTHTIDDSSPLSGLMTDAMVCEQVGGFLVFLKGVDASFQKHVYTSHVYHTPHDMRFGHWFETIMDYGDKGITFRKDMLSVTHTDEEEEAMGHRSSYVQ